MKKTIVIIPFVLMFFSCNEAHIDTGLIDDSTPVVNTIAYKTYDATTNTVNRTTTYTLNSNRIVSSTTVNSSTSQQSNSTYDYNNGQLSEVMIFSDNHLTSKRNYTYNNTNKLVEYLQESIDPSTQQSFFNQHTFTHTSDTIFSEWKRSSDGIIFNTIATFKIVLDSNGNRTYLEKSDLINNETKVKVSNYDGNNNLITENSFIKNDDNTMTTILSNNITYKTSMNLLSLVHQNTYGKENLMLLYHLQSNALNNFNPKTISNNSLKTFDSTFVGNSGITFEFLNETGADNYDYLNDYRTYINGTLLSRFTVEFSE